MILPNVIIQPFALARQARPRNHPRYPASPAPLTSAADLILLALAQAQALMRLGLTAINAAFQCYARGAAADYRLGLFGPAQEGSLFQRFYANRRES